MANKNKVIRKTIECIEYLSVEIKDLSVIQKVLRCIQWERQNFRN